MGRGTRPSLRGAPARVAAGLLLATLTLAPSCSDRSNVPAAHPPDRADRGDASDPFALPRIPLRFVDDRARALGPYENKLDRFCATYAKTLGLHLYVTTIRDSDVSLSDAAPEILDEREGKDPGPAGSVLILIDVAGRRARIEVSYDLEALYPDGFVGSIARYQIAPYASYRALGMAVDDATHILVSRALEAAADGSWEPPDAIRSSPGFRAEVEHQSGGAGAVTRIPLEPVDLDLKVEASPEMRRMLAPSPFASETIDAWILRNRMLVGDPTLEILTPGSRCQARFYPLAAFEALERAERLEKAKPLDLVVSGDRAVARTAQPVVGVPPLFLQRIDGTWRVDSAELYKSVFWTPDGGFVLRNERTPYAFGLRDLQRRDTGQDLSALDLGGEPLDEALARLEREIAAGPNAQAELRYAELLFRNCNAAIEALAHYREAARLAPTDRRILELTADRHLYTGFALAATPYLLALGPEAYPKLADAYWTAGRLADAEHYYRLALARSSGDQSDRIRRSLASLRREQQEQGG